MRHLRRYVTQQSPSRQCAFDQTQRKPLTDSPPWRARRQQAPAFGRDPTPMGSRFQPFSGRKGLRLRSYDLVLDLGLGSSVFDLRRVAGRDSEFRFRKKATGVGALSAQPPTARVPGAGYDTL
jgi:hypothetical protein